MSPQARAVDATAEFIVWRLGMREPFIGEVLEREPDLVRVVDADASRGDYILYLEWERINTDRLERALAEFLAFADAHQHNTFEVRIPREYLVSRWLRTDQGRQWLAEWLSARPESPVADSHSNVEVGRGGRI